MKLVVVQFQDPTTYGNCWETLDEADELKPDVCWAAGWLVEDSKEFVKIALLHNPSKKEVNGLIVLPKECVKDFEEIEGRE